MPERLRWSKHELYTEAAVLAMVWLKIYQSQGLIDLHHGRPGWNVVFIALIVASSLSVAVVDQQNILEDMARDADKREKQREAAIITEETIEQFNTRLENEQILEDIPPEYIDDFFHHWEELMQIAAEYSEKQVLVDMLNK
jgi:hypothetical protein